MGNLRSQNKLKECSLWQKILAMVIIPSQFPRLQKVSKHLPLLFGQKVHLWMEPTYIIQV